ncbi:MAG: Ig-like domain-containing protein [Crocinitomicaceae bacterium]|nr:Ig-like domain-containing protein [Crocinitomicaceae bacterium]
MKKRPLYFSAGVAALCLLMMSCAQIRGLDGGKKDETPARPLLVEPPSLSTGFTSSSFKIDFDEYVQLNNINQELIVSPPLKRPVKAHVKRKSVIVELQEPLEENTTYTFNFGDAITDINEGNITPLTYVVSTGSAIDSMVIKGVATIAWTGLPAEGARAILYRDMAKTHVFDDRPAYFSRVKKDGTFEIPYLAPGDYQLVVLDDGDGNYHLDGDEEFGYAPDSVRAEPNDSLAASHRIFLSKNKTERPFVPEYHTDSLGILSFPFRHYLGLPAVRLLGQQTISAETSFNLAEDSVFVWLMGKAGDGTVPVELSWRDSVLDTLDIPFLSERQKESWSFQPGFGKKIRSGEPLLLMADGWVEIADAGALRVLNDTTAVDVAVYRDTLWPARFLVEGSWQTGINYSLSLLPGAFVNGSGITNDTLRSAFSVYRPEDLGLLSFEFSEEWADHHLLFELENVRSQVVYRSIVPEGAKYLVIRDLVPGEYTARIIADENVNFRWDTGSYKENVQPEKVWIFPEKISVRANWEKKLRWQKK